MKIWQIKGRDILYSDDELIEAIKNGDIKADDYLINMDLPYEIKVADSIYAFYLEDNSLRQAEFIEDIN